MKEYELGSLIKSIRKSKKLTQSDLCRNDISRTTISKIENGKINPSVNVFLEILDRLQISIEEFLYLLKDGHMNKNQELIQEFFEVKNNCDLKKIINLEKKISKTIQGEVDNQLQIINRILNAQIQLSTAADINQITCLPKIVSKSIWEELSQYENWYLNELKFINSILFYFPLEIMCFIANRLVKEIQKYENYTNSKEFQLTVYFNISTIYFLNENYEECLKFIEKGIALSKITKRADILAALLFRKGVLEKKSALIEQGSVILDSLGEYALLEELFKEHEVFYNEKCDYSLHSKD